MRNADIRDYMRGKWGIIAIITFICMLCAIWAATGKMVMAIALFMCPVLLIMAKSIIRKPVILFGILFVTNYCILGLTRYISIPLPISVLMDFLMLGLAFVLCLSLIRGHKSFKQESVPFILIYGCWIMYCLVQLFNNTTGTGLQFSAWFKDVRPMALHAFYIIIIFTLLFDKEKHIKYFLYLWGVFILLATIKGYMQRNWGFDTNEWHWLMTVGGRTHLIHSGVRYFSFFSDAGNYGTNMAFSMVTYAICALYEQNKYNRICWIVIAIASGYGMLISGTRTAIAVAITGFVFFTLLSKNIRLFLISTVLLVSMVGILKFTTIGEGNQLVRRMRTAFDPEDASLQVRLTNQKAIRSYMKEAPWGIGFGLGMGEDQLPHSNKYWIVSVTAPDSTLVYLWMRTGIVGISVFLLVLGISLLIQSYIVLFKVKDKELRGKLVAFTCGSACMIVAAYGNFVYHQYPNTLLVFGLQTLVFMGPYFERRKKMKAFDKKQIVNTDELSKQEEL